MATEQTDQQRQPLYEIAEAIAPGWERRRAEIEAISSPVADWMIGELAPRAGDTVLELAAGAGDTGFRVSEIVGASGRLITSDLSPAMLAVARRRAAERGVDHVEYRQMDAESIEMEADSVDGVLCRFGYMLMLDVGAALAETRRVLRPGGRLALAVWGAPERNPFFTIVASTLVRSGHIPAPEPPPAPGIFSMASSERTTSLLKGAGFDAVRTEEVAVRVSLPDAEEYVDIIADTAGPIGLALQGLSAAERALVRTQVEPALEPFATTGGYELPGAARCAIAS